MNEDTVQKIVAKIDRGVKMMGLPNWESLIQFLQAGIQELGPGGPAILDAVGNSVHLAVANEIKRESCTRPPLSSNPLAINTREALIRLFKDQPEPSPSEVKEVLRVIDAVFSHYRAAFKHASTRIPHDPGGRPPRTEEAKAGIREEVDALVAKRVRKGVAQQRIADIHEKHKTTIQRMYRRAKVMPPI